MLKVASYEPDVAVVDIRMPPTHTDEGFQAAMRIRERHPGRGAGALPVRRARSARWICSPRVPGGRRLLAQGPRRRRGGVRRARCGGSATAARRSTRRSSSQLLGRVRGGGGLSELTPREREVLSLMAEGCSNQAIADKLVITVRSTRSTSRASSPSSACRPRAPSTAACSPSCATCGPEPHRPPPVGRTIGHRCAL